MTTLIECAPVFLLKDKILNQKNVINFGRTITNYIGGLMYINQTCSDGYGLECS